MRANPQKHTNLIYYNRNSLARNIDWQYPRYNYVHGQQPYTSFDNFYEEYESTLLKDARSYNKLVKEWTAQIITEYSMKNGHHNYLCLRRDDNSGLAAGELLPFVSISSKLLVVITHALYSVPV